MARWTNVLAVVIGAVSLVAGQDLSISPTGPDQIPNVQFRLTHSTDGNINDDLAPLTQQARTAMNNLNPGGGLALITDQNSTSSGGAFSYISCDQGDYPGFINAPGVVEDQGKTRTIILYSQTSDGCQIGQNFSEYVLFSMTNKDNSTRLLREVQSYTPPAYLGVQIGQLWQQNAAPPSTAVAMIILYSITGVITALFLVIIMTGAIRAHRHPERYGPQEDGTGRPRRSRARGLARAMLDTIPIVKFGENEPTKQPDVELGTTSQTANATREGSPEDSDKTSPATGTPATDTEKNEDANGIAAAEHGSQQPTGGNEESGLECSICAEDFERGQDIRVLPCDHRFHAGCVDQWLLNVSGTCPLCRIDLRARAQGNDEEDDTESPRDSFNNLAPPLEDPSDTTHRRRSTLAALVLRGRHMTQEERMQYLRTLREQNPGTTNGEQNNGPAAAGQRRRLTQRLRDRFGVRTHGSTDRESQDLDQAGSTPATASVTTSEQGQTVAGEPRVVADGASSVQAEQPAQTNGRNATHQ